MKDNLCIVCKETLKIGQFAYNQEICWNCFEQKVISISQMVESAEDSAIVIHLLNVYKEVQGRFESRDIKARCHSCGAIVPHLERKAYNECFNKLLNTQRLDKDVLR